MKIILIKSSKESKTNDTHNQETSTTKTKQTHELNKIQSLPDTNIISEHEFLCSVSLSATAMICDDKKKEKKKSNLRLQR